MSHVVGHTMSEGCKCSRGGGGANTAAFLVAGIAIAGLCYVLTKAIEPVEVKKPKNTLSIEVPLQNIADRYARRIQRDLEKCVGVCGRSGGGDTHTPPTPTQRPCSQLQGRTVTVQKGDTLYRIAWCNRVSVSHLARFNDIANPSALIPGQVLRVLPERGFRRTRNSEF